MHSHDGVEHESRERTWLFKPNRPERDRSLGEDLAEKLACEFASLVGVPAARVELARGLVSEDASSKTRDDTRGLSNTVEC